MKILCLTHADFETPGIIETWGLENKHHFKIIRPYQGENCLKKIDFDFLIIMGGPQSPLEIEKAPYLKDEITLIKQAILKDKIVLGFCLGAQLIGEALGGKTTRSPEKEVGVYPITLTLDGQKDPIFEGFTNKFEVIHWHNDMPPLTPNAVVLAYSEGCPRQVVRYGKHIYGFQCHMEISLEGIKTMVEACPSDLKASRFTQTAEQLMNNNYDSINEMMYVILERLSLFNEEYY